MLAVILSGCDNDITGDRVLANDVEATGSRVLASSNDEARSIDVGSFILILL